MGRKSSSLEVLVMNNSFWKNKTVLITGHTGFKGGWLTLILAELGARVHGYALEPKGKDTFYQSVKLEEYLTSSTFADVRDLQKLNSCFKSTEPEIVFHLAAQPLVLVSYQNPVNTYSTNVMGTVNLLECCRSSNSVRTIINVTSDKCYLNENKQVFLKETDSLGGIDPYSNSKSCAELVSISYRESFLNLQNKTISTVRAGNVIGGGDFSNNRLVPDLISAKYSKIPAKIRNPKAIRPWQHVLEPLSGYIQLAEKMDIHGAGYEGAWNFGPERTDVQSVEWIANQFMALNQDISWEAEEESTKTEAQTLMLDSSKANEKLGWKSKWNLLTALSETLNWYDEWNAKEDMQKISRRQIKEYMLEI
jgi:CDP-glucose 4,6-dehydratase